ncbi:MAG: potassium transporter Kup [Lysobacterales bacterium 69-70]|nr:potassium transporter Kup [Xanthomonadaceae bacterium]ODU36493.1 MAG: potassium transporter Kup [Xanthomonadaceae bacterium SCN 69-320]ODV17061.1 MAG: potassium transporter Kup [Xanthomonadaceae bacterium SCN 69-25]OJY96039.1 MAG: potassium transporter Kup [Xanthomonadales bacterium 69-70]
MSSHDHGNKNLYALALGAIGVVYGDIGTSPLYTLKEAFGPHGVAISHDNVLGVLSLIFWSLIVVVSIKYATFIMSADNKGEGGIMALTTLAHRGVRSSARARWFIMVLGLFGASLFFGDSVITPAISVLSAVEGLGVATPALNRYVVPIAVLVLMALFALQRSGTARVARVFAPIMVLWFLALAVLGTIKIVQAPQVLAALNPYYAVNFFVENGRAGFFVLAAVVLSVTGAEALYADMGHFGKRPIRRAWFAFVLPALMLNYLGQGALLLEDPQAAVNPFYLLAPPMLLYPMIVLATLAAVIASQAVISGAFSVTRQAIQLGYLPRMEVVHTSRETMGQIYLPWLNRALLVLTVAVVVGFHSSTNLAAAYGIAVVGTMAIDSVLVIIVARRIWNWKRWHIAALGGLFLIVDAAFLGANLEKVEHGGWFPLVLGLVVFTVMTTWRRGRELVIRELKQGGLALKPFIESIAEHPPLRVPGQAVFLTAQPDAVPHALLHNLKHNKVLHEQNVVLTVEWLETPTAEPEERIELVSLGHDFHQLTLRYGFAEDPDVPDMLAKCEKVGLVFDMMDTTFFLSRESIVATDRPGMPLWRDRLFAFMQRNALSATAFFQIPGNRLIELGTQVEI